MDVVAAQVDVADLEDLVAVDQVDAADALVIAADVILALVVQDAVADVKEDALVLVMGAVDRAEGV